jgi:hypothetical protein
MPSIAIDCGPLFTDARRLGGWDASKLESYQGVGFSLQAFKPSGILATSIAQPIVMLPFGINEVSIKYLPGSAGSI